MGLADIEKAENVNKNIRIAPILVLCDISGSMSPYISDLQKALQEMVDGLKTKPSFSSIVDLCIATFSTSFTPLLPFKILGYINTVPTVPSTGNATYLGMAVSESVKLLEKEKEMLKLSGDYVQPTLIILSDGVPYSEANEITQKGIRDIQMKIKTEHWTCIPILISPHFDDKAETILADFASPDKNGVCREYKFNSEDQVSNIIAGIKFASASIGTDGSNLDALRKRAIYLAGMSGNHPNLLKRN